MEPFPLSALNHYLYCPRRCALIHVEREFVENAHTTSGVIAHGRVDDEVVDHRSGVRVVHAVPLWSHVLGVTGKADTIEQHPDGRWVPVETKWGKREAWLNDEVQLCAQAICIEEMTCLEVPFGAIYHVQSRRRRDVALDDALRRTTMETAAAVRAMIEAQVTPEAVPSPRCEGCSMVVLCQPERRHGPSLAHWLREAG